MNRERLNNYEMLTRVVSFGNRNANLFPKKSAAAEILTAIESDVNALTESTNSAISTENAMRSTQNTKVAARKTLKRLLVQASRMCREFESPQLQLPKNATEPVLVALGRGFVADAESVKSEFAQHGLPIEEIETAVHNLENAVLEYSNAKAEHSTAIQEWNAALTDALGKLRRFGLLVENVLKDNPIALSEYTMARTIPKPASRKAAAAETSAEGAATTPVAAIHAAA